MNREQKERLIEKIEYDIKKRYNCSRRKATSERNFGMSEIEKMMQNANIISKRCSECDNNNMDCGYGKDCYPPFTAEKQIELIKFITTLGVCEIENWSDKGFHFAIKRERIYPTMFLSLSNINLQETLADVINNLWQDLTKEEKQQVKEILE